MACAKSVAARNMSGLSEDGLPIVEQRTKEVEDVDLRLKGMEEAVVSILKTPHRAAKAFHFFTKGYEESLEGNHV